MTKLFIYLDLYKFKMPLSKANQTMNYYLLCHSIQNTGKEREMER